MREATGRQVRSEAMENDPKGHEAALSRSFCRRSPNHPMFDRRRPPRRSLDVDALLSSAEDEASFELGRLKEVCASYRRLVWGDNKGGKRGKDGDVGGVFLGDRRGIRSRYKGKGEGKEKVDEALKMMGAKEKT